jgi:hypothetical protein
MEIGDRRHTSPRLLVRPCDTCTWSSTQTPMTVATSARLPVPVASAHAKVPIGRERVSSLGRR